MASPQAPTGAPTHDIVSYDPGQRLVAVQRSDGAIVETYLDPAGPEGASRLLRRVNGTPAPAPVFTGSPAEAGVVLDALASGAGASKGHSPRTLPTLDPSPSVAGDVRARRPLADGIKLGAACLSIPLLGVIVMQNLGYSLHRADPAHPAAPAIASNAPPAPARDPVAAAMATNAAAANVGPNRRPAGGPPAVSLPTVANQGAPALPTIGGDAQPPAPAPVAEAPKAVPAAPAQVQTAFAHTPGDAASAKAADGAKPATAKPDGVAAALKDAGPKADAKAPDAKSPDAKADAKADDQAAALAAPVAPTGNALVDRSKAADVQGAVVAEDARKAVEKDGTDVSQQKVEAMKKAYAMLLNQDKITPEMAEQLPNELAEKLREAHAILTPEEVALQKQMEGKTSFQIVRVPAATFEKMRDKDGIPTIPDSNSWAATGGNIRVPLPAGGDIRTPDDLKNNFHLEP